jgi:hypothetical protein
MTAVESNYAALLQIVGRGSRAQLTEPTSVPTIRIHYSGEVRKW